MIDDHKWEIIGITTHVYYLVRKKNPLSHISELCGLSELQGVVSGRSFNIMAEYFYVCGKIAWLSSRASTAATGAAGNNN